MYTMTTDLSGTSLLITFIHTFTLYTLYLDIIGMWMTFTCSSHGYMELLYILQYSSSSGPITFSIALTEK